MRIKILFFSLLTLLSCDQQKSDTTADNGTSDSATITILKIGYYTFPIVGLPDKAKADKINNYIINSTFGDGFNTDNLKTKLEEQVIRVEEAIKKSGFGQGWDLHYSVEINKSSVLSLTLASCGHRDCDNTQYNFDLTTGSIFGIDQIILPSKRYEIKQKMQDEFYIRLQQAKSEFQKNGGWPSDYEASIKREKVRFSNSELKKFKLSDKGISFVYESQPFAMVDINYFPSSDYFFSWNDLEGYLIPSSPVTPLIR